MKIISRSLLEKLRKVLIRQIGDARLCPHCNKSFIPIDITANEALDIYKILFLKEKS
jgi:hypothetical protein